MGVININVLEHHRGKEREKQTTPSFFGSQQSFSTLIFPTGEIPPSDWATSKME